MWVEKTNKAKKMFLWKVETPASQTEGVPPGWTVPVVICCPLRCNTPKHLHHYVPWKTPAATVFSYQGVSTFNYNLFRNRNFPELSVKTKVFFHKVLVLMSF